MSKLILSLAFVALSLGCKSNDQANTVDDASSANPAPAACEKACADKVDCKTMTECTGEKKAECSEKKVCPVTGQVQG
jgi:hypothetical protein